VLITSVGGNSTYYTIQTLSASKENLLMLSNEYEGGSITIQQEDRRNEED